MIGETSSNTSQLTYDVVLFLWFSYCYYIIFDLYDYYYIIGHLIVIVIITVIVNNIIRVRVFGPGPKHQLLDFVRPWVISKQDDSCYLHIPIASYRSPFWARGPVKCLDQ